MKFNSLNFVPQRGAPERCTQTTSASKRSARWGRSSAGFTLYVCVGAALIAVRCGSASAEDAARACALIHDDTSRLACYDQRFGSPVVPSKSAAADDARDTPPATGAKKDSSFHAAVTGIESRGDGKFVFSLGNGQVWAQTELNTRIVVRVGDTVRIRAGALGSFLLSNEAGIATRVRRLR